MFHTNRMLQAFLSPAQWFHRPSLPVGPPWLQVEPYLYTIYIDIDITYIHIHLSIIVPLFIHGISILSVRTHDKPSCFLCYTHSYFLRHVFFRFWGCEIGCKHPYRGSSAVATCPADNTDPSMLGWLTLLTRRSSDWIALFVSLCFFTKYGSSWKIFKHRHIIDTSPHVPFYLDFSLNLHAIYPQASPSQPSDVTFPVQRGDRPTWRCRSVWSRRPAQIHLMAFQRHIVTWSCSIHHFVGCAKWAPTSCK